MDKLSELILQARPLYKQRQRRKMIGKLLVVFTVPILMLSNLVSLYIEGNNVYTSLENNNIQTELLKDDFGFMELQ